MLFKFLLLLYLPRYLGFSSLSSWVSKPLNFYLYKSLSWVSWCSFKFARVRAWPLPSSDMVFYFPKPAAFPDTVAFWRLFLSGPLWFFNWSYILFKLSTLLILNTPFSMIVLAAVVCKLRKWDGWLMELLVGSPFV